MLFCHIRQNEKWIMPYVYLLVNGTNCTASPNCQNSCLFPLSHWPKQQVHCSGSLKNVGMSESESRPLLVGTLTKQENGLQLQCSVWFLNCPKVIDCMFETPGGQQWLCVPTGLVLLFAWPCPPKGKWALKSVFFSVDAGLVTATEVIVHCEKKMNRWFLLVFQVFFLVSGW